MDIEIYKLHKNIKSCCFTLNRRSRCTQNTVHTTKDIQGLGSEGQSRAISNFLIASGAK